MTDQPFSAPAGFSPGHFYSPIPDFADLARRRSQLWPERPSPPPGLDLAAARQRRLLRRLRRYAERYPYSESGAADPENDRLFHAKNPFFSGLDARLWHAFLHHWRPRRVIEVGSGHSTLLALDARREDPRVARSLTVIDPFPDPAVAAAIEGSAGCRLLRLPVQEAGLEPFASLAAGDVLFIDSTHVAKIGSDVVFLLLEVLPRLPAGVYVHLHDVFLPEEYPVAWVLGEGRAWNEQYLVQALLVFSSTLEVVVASAFAYRELSDAVVATFGVPCSGGSLWLRRIGPSAGFPRRQGRNRGGWWRRAGAAALCLLLGLGACELLLGLVLAPQGAPRIHRIDYAMPHHTLRQREAMTSAWAWWWSAPDGAADVRWLGRHGFRDRDWSAQPRAGTRRIAVIGDSFVEGLGGDEEATIPRRVERVLGQLGEPVEALNLGVAGGGFPEVLPLLRDAVAELRPHTVLWVIYDNDFGVALPDPAEALARVPPASRAEPFRLRLLELFDRLRSRRPVRFRWRPPAPAKPRPLDVAGRLAEDPQLRRKIDAVTIPGLRDAMLSGRLSPVAVDHLDRSLRGLPLPVAPRPVLESARRLAREGGVELRVAYLPTLNQVSDAYLPAQRAISPTVAGPVPSLRDPRFQQHARDLAAACAELGLPFFDLTPGLAAAEALGQRLYWDFDGHMRPAGYQRVGELLGGWLAED